ncbi:cationic peroxidase 1-like [Lycium barbarum]|uniref:cationic peroxidase 1-like n=1 Tax=Lycium barbarum TaxID=112863 RepID=UPI00293F2496|nr:cationic peroxidase 1-like [Lycium barbarum]
MIMEFKYRICLCMFLLLVGEGFGQLSSNFYDSRCPGAVSTIKRMIKAAVAKEPRMGASLLRLHFHDCFVNGCDASILLDDNATFTGEKTALPNVNSARGFDVIDDIKSELENICPATVSCADILTVAARDSVVALGGPSWNVKLGRRDSVTANLEGANTDLPGPFLDLSQLVTAFASKGFTASEMVTLSGAHTIGKVQCFLFRDRIYNEKNINPAYAAVLKVNCPATGGDTNLASLDVTTPDKFDNAYYTNLIGLKGILHSDQVLFPAGLSSTSRQVFTYSVLSFKFFSDFAATMVKMGNLSVLTGNDGQIRTNCRIVN